MVPTDLRVVKTLHQIDQALLTNLAEMPFDKITVDQLCQTAMVNRSTFYKYYKGKFDLMDQYLSRTLEEFRRQMDVAFINASPENIQNLVYQQNFEKALQFMYKHKREYLLLWKIPLEKPVFGTMVQVIHNNILESLTAPKGKTANFPQYVDLYAGLFASDMMTMVRWWFYHDGQIGIHEVRDLMRNNMKQGMFRTFRQYLDQ